MSFSTILYTILISPLQLFFEFIFVIAQKFTGNPGLSIIVLSLVMNFLVLPLYKRADALQAEERDTEAKLHDGLAHIKKSFSGDERMMIQQEYYRQNHYKTTDAFKGSVSLFLEIPFFIGAYQFLSNLTTLQGVSFGPLADLSAQDGLLVFGGMTLNLLPIIMTLVNIISCIIYTKGYPKKTKIQLYAMALFFLVFLYNSPSGLLFYWTLNNVFSLCKNIFYKMKNPKKVLAFMACFTGLALLGLAVLSSKYLFEDRMILIIVGVGLQLPVLLHLMKKKFGVREPGKANGKMFLLSALLLTVILGVLIPSEVLKSSPQEFVDIYNFRDPIWYVINAGCLAFGTFVIWFGVFYWLSDQKGRSMFEKTMWCICGASIMDYMFFGTNAGTLTSSLNYESMFSYETMDILVNIGLLVVLCIVMAYTYQHFRKFAAGAMATGIIAMAGMSFMNVQAIIESVTPLKEEAAEIGEEIPEFTLSKTGKNVIVFMLDRSMGTYVPYLMNENPELQEQFDGFTYYDNTVSYGWHTNFATPALFGGYEYTPEKLNERSWDTLAEKQNEALKVMPVLFDQNGYDVTVCDVPYGNYQWISDLSIYDEYPNIKKYHTIGMFNDVAEMNEVSFDTVRRNFFCYSLMKSAPLCTQEFLYNDGSYFAPKTKKKVVIDGKETEVSITAENKEFLDNYNVLKNLPIMTKVTNDDTNTFLMMDNDTTHVETILQEPEYEPSDTVDNTEYDAEHADRFTVNGRTMDMSNEETMPTYQINMASLMKMGKWFDYLREQGVYDNTRIIIVGDHGYPLDQFNELLLKDPDGVTIEDMEEYCPLLMVKDFNSTGFTTNSDFMTNGDVPTLATQSVIENPINPFTGKRITNTAKQGTQFLISSTNSDDWQTDKNNGYVFFPNNWYSVHDNIWDINNWKQEAQMSTSPMGN
jgi:YidC/Oxa1 family membrane protein insertase